jgi:hypothetical protein
VGDSGRGSSAFAGAVDIVLSLRRPEGNSSKAQRVIRAISRFSETLPELLVELTDDGYVALGEPHEAAVREAKDLIVAIAPESEAEAVDIEALMRGSNVPRATAQRAIKELLREKKLTRVGTGRKGGPFLYFRSEVRFCPTSDIEGQKETNGVSALMPREPGDEVGEPS